MQVLGLNMEQVNDFLDSCDWIGYERSELATVTGNFVLVMSVRERVKQITYTHKAPFFCFFSVSLAGKPDDRITSLHLCKFS